MSKLRIALSAGHLNWTSGNALEKTLTPELTGAYHTAFVAQGCDVRVLQADGPDPDDVPGDATFPGRAGDVAKRVVEWAKEGWIAQVYLESHTQAGGRGVFAIYPDKGGEKDLLSAELGLVMANAVSKAVGMPLWNTGLMPESRTAAGRYSATSRLAVFAETYALRGSTRRILIEHGSHTSEEDLAILRAPGNYARIATAVADSTIRWFNPREPKQPDVFFPETGFWLHGDFWDAWQQTGGLAAHGYPVAGATSENVERYGDRVVMIQYTQRSRFEKHADKAGNVSIMYGLVGAELLETRGW